MQRKWAVLAAAGALLSTVIAGCTERQGDLGNRDIRPNSIRYDMDGNLIMNKRFADDQLNEMNRMEGRRLNSNNIIGSHANYRLEMDDDIADRVAELKEVNKAYVMLTEYNAYVAVSLNQSRARAGAGGAGLQSQSATPAPLLGRTPQSYMRPYMNGYTGIRNGNTGGSYMNAATANVSTDLQARIAGIVQRMSPQIQNVYVSANPDFVARMTSYMDDVRLGHPIQSFVAEFNAMVERIFPAAPRGVGSTFPTDRVR
ncbi:YhcN/YlaJ family sporulation lipoprotein [Paenibacillus sp. sptzw28]|uniref:YhcN/YlaJ family sporulation lipoprotein n=1 Tax=Paenibacillus sp. sptzw28 TaxID=715179 RepID=UPI001C6F3583|nr:YhcN/YlaJ family sporulation lipoprotein [Paenibacillus sp. sptzw28]QYR23107.1 YhcN/YlaJ family sporulation lipoprotein [Paenibacillus sp. sptzw28]